MGRVQEAGRRLFAAKMRRRFVQAANSAEMAAAQLDVLAGYGDSEEARKCHRVAEMLRKASTLAMSEALSRTVSRPHRSSRRATPAKK